MEVKRSHGNIGGLNGNLGITDASRAQQAKSAYEGKGVDHPSRKNGVNVNLSETAKKRSEQMKKAFEIAKNTSAVREDRVAELKAKIEKGTYEVDAGKIADGILMEAVKDVLASTQL